MMLQSLLLAFLADVKKLILEHCPALIRCGKSHESIFNSASSPTINGMLENPTDKC